MKLIQFDGKLEREKGRFWQMGAYHKSVETHGIFGTLLGNKRLRKKATTMGGGRNTTYVDSR